MVSMGSCRVGPELRVTSADGQIIKQMQFDDDKAGEISNSHGWLDPWEDFVYLPIH